MLVLPKTFPFIDVGSIIVYARHPPTHSSAAFDKCSMKRMYQWTYEYFHGYDIDAAKRASGFFSLFFKILRAEARQWINWHLNNIILAKTTWIAAKFIVCIVYMAVWVEEFVNNICTLHILHTYVAANGIFEMVWDVLGSSSLHPPPKANT